MSSDNLIGIFIEPRKIKQIYDNIDNFFDVLKTVKLYFFCGKGLKSYFEKCLNYKNLIIIELTTTNLTPCEYSDLLKSSSFWNQFNNSAQYALIIQSDGCLCKNSPYKIEDFLNYDYIGGYTPDKWWWKETKGLHNYDCYQCFNGGFSLRNISACKDVIKNFPPKQSENFKNNKDITKYHEDLYFVSGMLKLKYNVGLDKFATNFCTHTHFINKTFCVHKLNHYDKSYKLQKFLNYCDDFKLFLSPTPI